MFSMDHRGTTKSKKQLRLSTKRKKRRLPLALLAAKCQSKELTTPTRTEPVVLINPPTSQDVPVAIPTSSNEFIPQLTSTPNLERKKRVIRKRRTVPPHLMKWRLTKMKRIENPANEMTMSSMTSNITPISNDPDTFTVCAKPPDVEKITDVQKIPDVEQITDVEKIPDVQREILEENTERQFDELVVEPDRRPPRDDVEIISGRFIVDGRHFVKEIRSLDYHRFECEKNSNGYMALVTSSIKSLEWSLKFRCPYCLKEKIINSEPHQLNAGSGSNSSLSDSPSKMPLVDQVVWGFSSIGSGHRNMEEVLSSINISPISEKAFRRAEERLGQVWQDVLYDSMIEAGAEEKKLAIENGDVSKNNIPFITVIVDGGWSHRSHGHRYSANSGVACVIGRRTKKLLHIDVRNKYCSMCAYLEKKGTSTGHKKCFKNWSGPSASMESDMLVEAFNSSQKIHGVQYRKMIGDGDSSVHQKVREMVPYGRFVEKIECTNHIIKNYTKRLYKLRSNGNTEKRFLNVNIIKRLKAAARGAIIHHSSEKNIENLKEDLRNSPLHVLGNHLRCKPYFCTKVGTGKQLEGTSLFVANKVLEALKPVLLRANFLWENQTSNLAENYMSLVAKFTGGKQINRGKRGSFTFRARAAALDFQYGPMWHYKSMKSHLKRSPAVLVKKIGLRRTKRLMTCRRALIKKMKEGKTKNTVTSKVTKEMSGTKDYGSFCQRLDLEDNEFEEEKSDLLKSLALSEEEKASIEVETRGQRENSRWLEERKIRLTASNFGLICKRRPKSLWAPVVKQLLYNKVSTGAMMYGELNESAAIQCFEKKHDTKVLPCGLFIDKTLDFLAASPDGVVGEQDLIEVKCPKSAELLTIPEAVKQIKSFCLAPDKSSKMIKLKRNHNYYYQVQGQLHIANKINCYFVVWTKKDVHVEVIERDDRFWKEKMEKALCYFYNCALLPELVDPRTCRSMPIREPQTPLAGFAFNGEIASAK